MRQLAITLALGMALSACSAEQLTRGYVPEEDRLAEVKAGISDRASVEELLGSPSSMGTFEDKTWYYITRRTEKLAFFDENMKDQLILAIVFDDAGVVSDVRRYSLEDVQEIEPVERVTPTRGREMTVFEQLLGNIGRFSRNTGAEN